MEPIFIPFGTRCSAALILKNIFRKRFQSLPFDWIDIPLKNISRFSGLEFNNSDNPYFGLNYDEIDEYIKLYFSGVVHQNHYDGTYFPHDFAGNFSFNELCEKYSRRMKRFYEILNSEKVKIFFTVNSRYLSDQSIKSFIDLREVIRKNFSHEKCIFVTVNVMPVEMIVNDCNYDFIVPVPKNLSEMTGNDWGIWETDIAERISLSPVGKYFTQGERKLIDFEDDI